MAKIADLNNLKSSINIEQLKLEADVGTLKYVVELIYGDNAKGHLICCSYYYINTYVVFDYLQYYY